MRVPMLIAFAATLAAATLDGQPSLSQMLDRLGREAEAFQRIAPNLQGLETLHQRALKPPARFRIKAGDDAKKGSGPELQEREIVSAYGFAALGPEHALHEIRQVISVDGRKVRDRGNAQDLLAKLVTAGDGDQKLQSL